jgi:predicted nucleic acid-binding protein
LALLYDAPIERVSCRELHTAARRFGIAMSGYALYAALARSLRCPLVTTDGPLARASSRSSSNANKIRVTCTAPSVMHREKHRPLKTS